MQTSRRSFLAAAAAAPALATTAAAEHHQSAPADVRYCLNTSTVRGQNLSVPQQVDLAASAGYDGIEPWLRDLDAYAEGGGSLADLKTRIADAGLRVESGIGFAKWSVNDNAERAAGLEAMRKDMQTIAAVGGTRIAAPPIGMHTPASGTLDLDAAAERYNAVLRLGEETGVTPQLEFWGPASNLFKLPQALYVAAAAGHPDACLLPDIYHMFRGGTSFDAVGLLAGTAVHCFHLNDYPGGRPREQYDDADRVYPGEGVAPVPAVIRSLLDSGFAGALSLELFNKDYWKRPAEEVAAKGLAAMKAAVAAA